MIRLILGPDAPLISEMVTTTEASTASGHKVYHPQRRDDDHRTDALRCVALAIRDLDRDEAPEMSSFGGWAGGFGGVGTGTAWNSPWDTSLSA